MDTITIYIFFETTPHVYVEWLPPIFIRVSTKKSRTNLHVGPAILDLDRGTKKLGNNVYFPLKYVVYAMEAKRKGAS